MPYFETSNNKTTKQLSNMKTEKDYSLALIAGIFGIALITSLPFAPKSSLDKAVEIKAAQMSAPVKYYDMSQAKITVFNVDQFTIENGFIFLADHVVETELDEQSLAELFYTKEEIAVRIDGNRISIIAGDNGQF